MAKTTTPTKTTTLTKTVTLALGVLFAVHGSALSSEADLRKIAEQCGIQLKLSTAACACVSGAAGEQLSDKQQAFMVAQVTKNGGEFTRLQSEMTIGEMTAVGNFMTSIVAKCQR